MLITRSENAYYRIAETRWMAIRAEVFVLDDQAPNVVEYGFGCFSRFIYCGGVYRQRQERLKMVKCWIYINCQVDGVGIRFRYVFAAVKSALENLRKERYLSLTVVELNQMNLYR